MQIKYSYIYTDTYTTNNYDLITKTNIMKQQQQYTKQTTNTLQQKYNKANKAKNQLRLRVFTLIQQQVHFL